jgi:hypothetical protein
MEAAVNPVKPGCKIVSSVRKLLRASPAVVLGLGALVSVLAISPLLSADEPASVMRVEEDWEVVLNEPGENVDAPQFHTIISPYASLDSFHLQVCWNYRELPEFAAGGLQLIARAGDYCVGRKTCRANRLSTVAETITWTSAIETNGSILTFEIASGQSTTWGSFGGPESRLSGAVHVPYLNGYSTDFSADKSWISYGANRVNLLRIKEVRRYDGAGNLISRDTTPRVVFELD